MSKIVLDCSVAMGWHFEDENNPYAEAILDMLQGNRAWVPALFYYEIANALRMAEIRNRTTDAKTDEFLNHLVGLVDMDNRPPWEVLPAIQALARTHNLTAYDAAYLELAQYLALPLATLDQDLRKAATRIDVPVLQVM